METNQPDMPMSFEEAVLKAKVAQICDSVGYHAITQESSNILVDIYRRTIYHLARHCKDAANNNGRTDPTFIDLIQAYDFVGISISELKEHIDAIKLPLIFDITRDEDEKPVNRIHRNLHVDDLLEAEKNSHLEDKEDGENQPSSDIEGEDRPGAPLLKDAYVELASQFSNCNPVTADKKIGMGGRITLVNTPKLKISPPIPPVAKPSTSEVAPDSGKKKKKKEMAKKRKLADEIVAQPEVLPPPIKVKKKKKEIISKKIKLAEEVVVEPTVATESPIKVKKKKDEISKKRKLPEELITDPTPPTEPIKVKKKKKFSKEFVSPKPKKEKQVTKEKEVTIKNANKKVKPVVTPLDPAIAEPPSFFPIPLATPSVAQEDLCPECNLPDDGSMMIQCDDPFCAKWFHGKCVNLLEEPKEDESWFCRVCVDKQQSAFERRRRAK